MIRAVKIIVKGRVQGVWFRAGAQLTAQKLHIIGSVSNQPDHTVKIVAQGSGDAIEKLIDWCYVGTPFASVSAVDIEDIDEGINYSKFEILF